MRLALTLRAFTTTCGMLPVLFVLAASGCDRSQPTAPSDREGTSRERAPGNLEPSSWITFGPRELGSWGTNVEFRWEGQDDDGFVDFYRYALTSLDEWRFDHPGEPEASLVERVAWLDTLQYRPLPGGGYDSTRMWKDTSANSRFFPELPVTDGTSPPNTYLFAVRAVDDQGLQESILDLGVNTRQFKVTSFLNGPRLSVVSAELSHVWRSSDPVVIDDVVGPAGLRFVWEGTPGPSGSNVVGYQYAVEDTSQWSPFSAVVTSFPETPNELWFPDAGYHSFFVRALDLAGFLTTRTIQLFVQRGPLQRAGSTVLVVLDTDAASLIQNSVLPPGYASIERSLVDYWFDGVAHEIHQTQGSVPPSAAQMSRASSVFWFHTAVIDEGDDSLLNDITVEERVTLLSSYLAAGGNLFLCGTEPSLALRYFSRVQHSGTNPQSYPVRFATTLTDTTLVPHWIATRAGILVVSDAVGNTNTAAMADRRLRTAMSRIVLGANPYPDLPFDPLTWPTGPALRGFGYYDEGVHPRPDTDAEIIYDFNDQIQPIAVRRLSAPGLGGNVVYLGFHPYWVERPAFREFVSAVLEDFGEKLPFGVRLD